MFILSVAIALDMTAAAAVTNLPPWLEHFSSIYEDCLFKAIDRQYEAKRFSEARVFAQCAETRHVQIRKAEAASKIDGSEDRKELIDREFARLDNSVRTIIGHIRVQRTDRRAQ